MIELPSARVTPKGSVGLKSDNRPCVEIIKAPVKLMKIAIMDLGEIFCFSNGEDS
jgi:hypothetical protein